MKCFLNNKYSYFFLTLTLFSIQFTWANNSDDFNTVNHKNTELDLYLDSVQDIF